MHTDSNSSAITAASHAELNEKLQQIEPLVHEQKERVKN